MSLFHGPGMVLRIITEIGNLDVLIPATACNSDECLAGFGGR